MANTRPIRRGRIPFRRGRRVFGANKLDTRWIDCASSRSTAGAQCSINVKDLTCEEDVDLAPVQLLYGDTDWDWADASEVRIDRMVGTLSWESMQTTEDAIFGCPTPMVVRLGILATEEDEGVHPNPNLFDPESLEEFQWMWLYSSLGSISQGGTLNMRQWDNIDVDIRTRRKLGRKDSVWLFGQYKFNSSVGNQGCPGTLILNPRVSHSLRAIIRS